MLLYSLILSLLLLVIVNWIVRRSREPVLGTLVVGIVFTIGPALLTAMFPVLLLQIGLLLLVVISWWLFRSPAWTFLPLSCIATLAAYGVGCWNARQSLEELRERYPYASVEARVPLTPDRLRSGVLSVVVNNRLDRLEAQIEGTALWAREYHTRFLRNLHEDTLQTFVNRPGFGVTRMTLQLGEWGLTRARRTQPSTRQPGVRFLSTRLLLELTSPLTPETHSDLELMHQEGVFDFVHPDGFGYVKDRRHVVGFQEHQFSTVPEAKEWRVETLDLMGLLKHEEPVVYVSQHLPRMDELRDAPTRALDDFEAKGLKMLQSGEDLIVQNWSEGKRMLGAIRSVKQCLSCHGGERGDLLGAFSYTLTRSSR